MDKLDKLSASSSSGGGGGGMDLVRMLTSPGAALDSRRGHEVSPTLCVIMGESAQNRGLEGYVNREERGERPRCRQRSWSSRGIGMT